MAIDVARWDVRFDHLREEGLRQAHLDFRRALNIDFGRFVEEGYRHWVVQPDRRPLLSTDVVKHAVVPHLKAGRRVVFIVIDCMRLHQWSTLEPLLEDYFDLKREYYCSILPTATPYARNAIFSGLLPAQLRQRHPDLWQENSNDERTKNRYERQLMDLQLERMRVTPEKPVKYVKIYDADEAHSTRRQIGSFKDLALMSMVFNFIDILAHGRSESDILQELAPDEAAFRSVMRAWFTHSPLFDILRALSTHDSTVVITDRKSTRLNSSHLGISYAVFCLKKKKINTIYNYITNIYIERND